MMPQNLTMPQDRLKPFAYTSAVGTDAFRLIKILPEDGQHHASTSPGCVSAPQVNLQIETFHFDQRPEYYALSYTWGPADFDTEETDEMIPISVDGGEFLIRPNLRDALLQLRRSYPDTWFWIDAVCINQDDLAERSSQVATMDVIYMNGTRTVAWIGKAGPRSERGIEIIKEIATKTEEVLAPASFADSIIKSLEPERLEAAGYPVLTREDWMALRDVIDRRWFSRLWVVQEVVLSPHVEVRCEEMTVPWHFLEVSVFVLTMRKHYFQNVMAEFGGSTPRTAIFQWVTQMHTIKGLMKELPLLGSNPVDRGLVNLLWMTDIYEYTDARDRFFAVFGILKQAAAAQGFDLPAFRVDHRASVCDVFCALAGDHITRNGNLEIVGWKTEMRSQLEGLPSWAPDWSLRPQIRSEGVFFQTANASKSNGKTDHGIKISGKKLHCRGLRIAAVTEVMNSDTSWYEDWPSVQHVLSLLDRMETTYHFTKQPRLEVVFRTMMKNRIGGSLPFHYLGNKPELTTLFTEYLLLGAAKRADVLEQAEPESLAGFVEALDRIAATDDSGMFPSLDDVVEWKRLMDQVTSGNTWPPEDEEGRKLNEEWAGKLVRFMGETSPFLWDRRCAFLQGGYLANVPENSEMGDEIWVLRGANVPFVLRRGENEEEWVIVGSVYVHGIMDGEAVTDDSVWEDICIV